MSFPVGSADTSPLAQLQSRPTPVSQPVSASRPAPEPAGAATPTQRSSFGADTFSGSKVSEGGVHGVRGPGALDSFKSKTSAKAGSASQPAPDQTMDSAVAAIQRAISTNARETAATEPPGAARPAGPLDNPILSTKGGGGLAGGIDGSPFLEGKGGGGLSGGIDGGPGNGNGHGYGYLNRWGGGGLSGGIDG